MQQDLKTTLCTWTNMSLVHILYPRTVTVTCLCLAERAGEWKSLIRLQVAKSNEPHVFCVLQILLCCSAPHPEWYSRIKSNYPPSVLNMPNAIIGKYLQTRLRGDVSTLQSTSNDPSD
jgi:hypothetical protein